VQTTAQLLGHVPMGLAAPLCRVYSQIMGILQAAMSGGPPWALIGICSGVIEVSTLHSAYS